MFPSDSGKDLCALPPPQKRINYYFSCFWIKVVRTHKICSHLEDLLWDWPVILQPAMWAPQVHCIHKYSKTGSAYPVVSGIVSLKNSTL